MAGWDVVTQVPKLPVRPRDGHKGTFGRVFVVGGSRGMIGAPCLAAQAAMRSGAGLVQVGVPAGLVHVAGALLLEQTIVPLAGQSALEMNAQAGIMEVARDASCVVFGPGLGPGPGISTRFSASKGSKTALPALELDDGGVGEPDLEDEAIVTKPTSVGGRMSRLHVVTHKPEDTPAEGEAAAGESAANDTDGEGATVALPQQAVGLNRLCATVIQRLRAPLVLDADGLNAIASRPLILASRRGRTTIITPHPGEMARITGLSVEAIAKDREKIAAEWALKLQSIVVLKGAGTVVTDGRKLYVNTTGNPGMATGGSGDVLAGVIGALIGQGLSAFDAAVLGVHAHGLAGDLAAHEMSETGLIARDIIAHLPAAWKKLTAT
ncbi:MAG TPA: NAD(P)H-hydrate dehydratase [Planctomycetota bacterium]|nr:NAD(P)H-hydrate dehydratase [Planctomycetota bacterium]